MNVVLWKRNGAPAYLNILLSSVAFPIPTREMKALRSQQNSTWVKRAFDAGAVISPTIISVKVSNIRRYLMKELRINVVVEDSRAAGDGIECDCPEDMSGEAAQLQACVYQTYNIELNITEISQKFSREREQNLRALR